MTKTYCKDCCYFLRHPFSEGPRGACTDPAKVILDQNSDTQVPPPEVFDTYTCKNWKDEPSEWTVLHMLGHQNGRSSLVAEKERLIRDAITFRIGHELWSNAAVASRGSVTCLHDGSEIFKFDGFDMIHFSPSEVDDHGQLKFKYRLLYK